MRGRGRAGARPGGRPHAAPQVMLHRNKNDVTQQRRRFGLGKAKRANRRCTRQARMQRGLQKTPHGGGGGRQGTKKIRGRRICGLGEGFLAMLSRTASPGSPRSPGKARITTADKQRGPHRPRPFEGAVRKAEARRAPKGPAPTRLAGSRRKDQQKSQDGKKETGSRRADGADTNPCLKT